ncbi:MAG: hypothetical protein LLG24_07775 [Actinomycetia bacterium]|nr:hypothetical protein [Actinomycetes bacterium]
MRATDELGGGVASPRRGLSTAVRFRESAVDTRKAFTTKAMAETRYTAAKATYA